MGGARGSLDKKHKKRDSHILRTAFDRHWGGIESIITCHQLHWPSTSTCRSREDAVHFETQESIGPQTFEETNVTKSIIIFAFVIGLITFIWFQNTGFSWQLSNILRWWRPSKESKKVSVEKDGRFYPCIFTICQNTHKQFEQPDLFLQSKRQWNLWWIWLSCVERYTQNVFAGMPKKCPLLRVCCKSFGKMEKGSFL